MLAVMVACNVFFSLMFSSHNTGTALTITAGSLSHVKVMFLMLKVPKMLRAEFANSMQGDLK